MHHGCVGSGQPRREGSGRVVADIAKLSVGREAYYTRELATDHEQYLSGHGESPGRPDGHAMLQRRAAIRPMRCCAASSPCRDSCPRPEGRRS
jgi:hypothetical protein